MGGGSRILRRLRFIGCVGLIFIAKGLRLLVKRKENYYD